MQTWRDPGALEKKRVLLRPIKESAGTCLSGAPRTSFEDTVTGDCVYNVEKELSEKACSPHAMGVAQNVKDSLALIIAL